MSRKTRTRSAPGFQSAAARPARAPSAFERRAQALGRSPLAFALASAALLLPCFWQSRIQAGDLSSHIYNAWLTQLIETGRTSGLALVPQSTNVLVDAILTTLLRAMGPDAAQRITVGLCVLVFAWGAFAFVSAVSGRRAWHLFPAIAILAYGWTFHMGFFNFYLSLGLGLFALAAAWTWKPKGLAAAAALLAVAYLAHGLGVAWAGALLVYRWLALRSGERGMPGLLGLAAGAIVVLRLALELQTRTRWSSQQILAVTAADQASVYGARYLVPLAGLLLLWAVLFIALLRQQGIRRLSTSLPFHLWLLTAAGIFLIPTAVEIPGNQHALVAFIADRMSLALGVCYCALLAGARPPAFARYLALAVMLLFFGFLYRDDAVLNRYEDRMRAAVMQLKDQRVVTGINDPAPRVNPFPHMIDRACLGVCYSYANYEPSSGHFRVRAREENPFVASTYEHSWLLQNGMYVVQPRDVPLYRVDLDADGAMVVRAVPAGATTGMTNWDLLQ